MSGCSNLDVGTLLDHLIGAREQRDRRIEAERLGSLEIDDKFEFGCKLHWKIARLFPLEDAIDVRLSAPVKVDIVDAIGRQASAFYKVAKWVDGRQAVPGSQINNQVPVRGCEGASNHDQTHVRLSRK